MKFLLISSALAAMSLAAPAFAQQATTRAGSATKGEVTIQGVEPSKVLGAIDTSKLVDAPAVPPLDVTVTAKQDVTVDTRIDKVPGATVETRTETIATASGRQALDPETPIAPEVAAVINSGRKYSTQDIVLAQLAAVRNTPVIQPTTTITTTITTADPG
jgi:hypothetical protein